MKKVHSAIERRAPLLLAQLAWSLESYHSRARLLEKEARCTAHSCDQGAWGQSQGVVSTGLT